jgi:hypothetical protein
MDNNRAGDDNGRSELNRKTEVSKVGITAGTEERERPLVAHGGKRGQKVSYGSRKPVATGCD